MRLTKGTCARVPHSRPSSPLCSLAPVISPLFPLTSLVSCFSLPFCPSTCSCADPSKTKQHPRPPPPPFLYSTITLWFSSLHFFLVAARLTATIASVRLVASAVRRCGSCRPVTPPLTAVFLLNAPWMSAFSSFRFSSRRKIMDEKPYPFLPLPLGA